MKEAKGLIDLALLNGAAEISPHPNRLGFLLFLNGLGRLINMSVATGLMKLRPDTGPSAGPGPPRSNLSTSQQHV